MPRNNQSDNQALLLALSHPIRRQVLRLMEDDEEHSPASLASKLEAELTTISYHVRVLHSCRVILAVREDQVRGVTQHVYRRTLNTPWALDLLAEEGANPMT